MINGSVTGREARAGVIFRLSQHSDLEIEFVVDTGFAGFLELPPTAVSRLGLPYSHQINSILADGSTRLTDVHIATILWDGVEMTVDVLSMGNRPLLGTMLMDGFDLQIQFADGGLVTLELM
jgi:clan AA aspartic protease